MKNINLKSSDFKRNLVISIAFQCQC